MTATRADVRETVARWICAYWLGDDALWDVSDEAEKEVDYERADRLLAVLEQAGLVIVAADRFERLRQEAEWMQIAHDDGGGWGDSILHPGDLDPLTKEEVTE